MGRNRTRSPKPIDLGRSKHGASGYNKGCGCPVCVKGKSDQRQRSETKHGRVLDGIKADAVSTKPTETYVCSCGAKLTFYGLPGEEVVLEKWLALFPRNSHKVTHTDLSLPVESAELQHANG